MNTTFAIGTLLAAALSGSAAAAQNVWIEDFEGGGNDGAWELWWSNYNTLETIGGNPGGYLRLDNTQGSLTCQFVDLFPGAQTGGFSGDWRALSVGSVAFDLDVAIGPFLATGVFTLTLANDNGTPGNDADDCLLTYVPSQAPPISPGWTAYDFPVPVDSPTLPAGWSASGSCAAGPDALWNAVIQDVDYFEVRIDYDPASFCLFYNWDMGVDNLRLVAGVLGSAYCFGDGTATGCPCGNLGGAGEGCANSSGAGATLVAGGSLGVGADDLTFGVDGGPGSVPALLFAGTTQLNGGAGVIFGDGLRCAGGQVRRLGVQFTDGAGSATWGPGLGAQGGWSAGDARAFQVWYRDVSPNAPCGFGFNLSHGLGLSFTP